MIVITVYGLDEYTVGHYSGEHTANLASLFEVSEDQIVFNANGNYVYHKGVEQTSWNAIIEVIAPDKFEPMEEKVAKYLLETFKEFSIHLTLNFRYFHGHHQYEKINKEYPRFITEENAVNYEGEEDDDELFEGNAFEGVQEKLDELYKEDNHFDCGCDDEHCDCDCEDDHCDCEDGECHCGHKH